MNYASDTMVFRKDNQEEGNEPPDKEKAKELFVSSSFYDQRLCLWEANL